jgi:hypothetical protein
MALHFNGSSQSVWVYGVGGNEIPNSTDDLLLGARQAEFEGFLHAKHL